MPQNKPACKTLKKAFAVNVSPSSPLCSVCQSVDGVRGTARRVRAHVSLATGAASRLLCAPAAAAKQCARRARAAVQTIM